jgi:hypothetical protein
LLVIDPAEAKATETSECVAVLKKTKSGLLGAVFVESARAGDEGIELEEGLQHSSGREHVVASQG